MKKLMIAVNVLLMTALFAPYAMGQEMPILSVVRSTKIDPNAHKEPLMAIEEAKHHGPLRGGSPSPRLKPHGPVSGGSPRLKPHGPVPGGSPRLMSRSEVREYEVFLVAASESLKKICAEDDLEAFKELFKKIPSDGLVCVAISESEVSDPDPEPGFINDYSYLSYALLKGAVRISQFLIQKRETVTTQEACLAIRKNYQNIVELLDPNTNWNKQCLEIVPDLVEQYMAKQDVIEKVKIFRDRSKFLPKEEGWLHPLGVPVVPTPVQPKPNSVQSQVPMHHPADVQQGETTEQQ